MYKDSDLEKHLRETIRVPAVLDSVIDTLNSDLYPGPCYRNKWGEPVSMWDDDEGIHQFDFVRGCQIVTDWFGDRLPYKLYYETWSGEFLSSEPEPWEDEDGTVIEPDYSEYYEIDHSYMVETLLGRELANHCAI